MNKHFVNKLAFPTPSKTKETPTTLAAVFVAVTVTGGTPRELLIAVSNHSVRSKFEHETQGLVVWDLDLLLEVNVMLSIGD